jgi:hypothetical protein
VILRLVAVDPDTTAACAPRAMDSQLHSAGCDRSQITLHSRDESLCVRVVDIGGQGVA